jgi:hypothetical protein
MHESAASSPAGRRLRVLTWHVHGNYLYYLSQAPHDFFLLTLPGHPPGHAGRVGRLPWGDNVHEVPAEHLAGMAFDCVLYQHRAAFDEDRLRLLTPAQRALPALYLEHDPPQQHPTSTRHWASEVEGVHLVHCTAFNALMWDSGAAPVSVIEHGVKLPANVQHLGDKAEGLVVVNNLRKRGRRLGLDVFEQVRAQVPLVLVGMDAASVPGGLGEVPNPELPAFMARYRFFFNPIRYTSLGLSVLEAMGIGMPVVALATTELPSVIANGVNGYIDTRLDRLVEVMHELLRDPALARRWGDAAQRTVRERFGIERFAADWDRVLRRVVGERVEA